MKEEEKIALFDQYLRNELPQDERDKFELDLNENESLSRDLEAYKALSAEIYEGESYGEIKQSLRNIHTELYGKKKFILFQPKFLIPMASAAAIALLLTVYNINSNETAQGDAASDYNELTSELDDSQTSKYHQEEASEVKMTSESDVDSATTILSEMLPISDSEPKGSCFLISKNGYFITSKHLVIKRRYVKIQQKDRGIAFNAEVIYRDSASDFAILKCSEEQASNFSAVPFKFYSDKPKLGDQVFTLGYPKSDIVYTSGEVSSDRGFRSDSLSFQITMPSNPGNSGAPLFTSKGDLVGMVIANNSKKQSVTYVLKSDFIQDRITYAKKKHPIDMSKNYTKRFHHRQDLIAKYRPFIFEIH